MTTPDAPDWTSAQKFCIHAKLVSDLTATFARNVSNCANKTVLDVLVYRGCIRNFKECHLQNTDVVQSLNRLFGPASYYTCLKCYTNALYQAVSCTECDEPHEVIQYGELVQNIVNTEAYREYLRFRTFSSSELAFHHQLVLGMDLEVEECAFYELCSIFVTHGQRVIGDRPFWHLTLTKEQIERLVHFVTVVEKNRRFLWVANEDIDSFSDRVITSIFDTWHADLSLFDFQLALRLFQSLPINLYHLAIFCFVRDHGLFDECLSLLRVCESFVLGALIYSYRCMRKSMMVVAQRNELCRGGDRHVDACNELTQSVRSYAVLYNNYTSFTKFGIGSYRNWADDKRLGGNPVEFPTFISYRGTARCSRAKKLARWYTAEVEELLSRAQHYYFTLCAIFLHLHLPYLVVVDILEYTESNLSRLLPYHRRVEIFQRAQRHMQRRATKAHARNDEMDQSRVKRLAST